MAIEDTLSKLDGLIGKHKKKGRTDFKEIKEIRERNTLKLKEGKNQVVFVKPLGAEDPFFAWGSHKSLQEVDFWTVPCNAFNSNEECVACNVVKDLQLENWEKNRHIWSPIQQQTEVYGAVINLESEATIKEGIKWLRLSKTIVGQLTEWLRNVEKGEEPFYSEEEPQKIIITYDKSETPANQYKLTNKNMAAFPAEQLAIWKESLRPIADFNVAKTNEEMTKIVDSYFARIEDAAANSVEPETANTAAIVEVGEQVKSKLDSLKKSK